MGLLMETVRSIIVYLLLITLIMNLVGNSTYRKYIGVFTGILLILLILRPVMKLFHMEQNFDYYTFTNQFRVSSSELKDDLILAEEAGKQAILSEYEEEIGKQLEKVGESHGYLVKKVSVSCEEDDGESGQIAGLSLTVTDMGDPMEPEKIRIEGILVGPDPEEASERAAGEIELGSMKKEIAGIYGLAEEQVKIRTE